jgi:hypothetical protein
MFSFLLNILTIKPPKRSMALALSAICTTISLSFTKLLSILFVPLLLVGCGEWEGDDDGDLRNLSTYTVSFYDDELEFLETKKVVRGGSVDLDAKATEYGVANWYLPKNSTPTEGTFTPRESVRFYAAADVTEISDQSELNSVRGNLLGRYILIQDIALEARGDGFDETLGWLPIGDSIDRFSGIFNGNFHKISGLWINRPSDNDIGLFGYAIDRGTVIKNLGVLIDDNGGIKGRSNVGAIAGTIYNTVITNSYSIGNVSSENDQIGGIAGYVGYTSTISNSYSKASVNGRTAVGGIAGSVHQSSTVTNSYSAGDVGGTTNVGGIAGNVGVGSTITNTYSKSSVNGHTQVGGIAGYSSRSSMTNSTAINQEIEGMTETNRIVGYVTTWNFVLSNNFALDTIKVNGSVKNSNDADGLDGADKTDGILKTQATYEMGLGWAFGSNASHPWKMDEDGGYPCLYWED